MREAPTLRNCRILVAEDEFVLAYQLRAELDDAEAIVVGPVGRLAEVLELIGRGEPLDGAVLDVNLRGEMSFSAADLLLERGVPVVFSTGYDKSAIPDRFANVVRCEKPLETNYILKAIDQAIHA